MAVDYEVVVDVAAGDEKITGGLTVVRKHIRVGSKQNIDVAIDASGAAKEDLVVAIGGVEEKIGVESAVHSYEIIAADQDQSHTTVDDSRWEKEHRFGIETASDKQILIVSIKPQNIVASTQRERCRSWNAEAQNSISVITAAPGSEIAVTAI